MSSKLLWKSLGPQPFDPIGGLIGQPEPEVDLSDVFGGINQQQNRWFDLILSKILREFL